MSARPDIPHPPEAPEMPEPNDPTRSGSPIPAGQGAHLSDNEIEQLCLKAARGAGLSWGLAEEAGFACVWLARHGLDGPGALLAWLGDRTDPATPDPATPDPARTDPAASARAACDAADPFLAGAGGRCPIATGAALCDFARLPETDVRSRPLRIGPLARPLLLLPFLADLARLHARDLRMTWPGGEVVLTAEGGLCGDVEALARADRLAAEIATAAAGPDRPPVPRRPLFLASATIAGLNEMALRTTVPASEASRADAGAGTDDND